MVKLHLKQGDESLFLYETTCQAELSELIPQIVRIQNGRLKIERLSYGELYFASVESIMCWFTLDSRYFEHSKETKIRSRKREFEKGSSHSCKHCPREMGIFLRYIVRSEK